MEHTPKADLHQLLADAAQAQASPVGARLALAHLNTLVHRALEVKDPVILKSLENLGLVERNPS